MHPAVQHIKRLQEEKRELVRALFLEREYRQEMQQKYMRRLMGRFMWIIDMISHDWKNAP